MYMIGSVSVGEVLVSDVTSDPLVEGCRYVIRDIVVEKFDRRSYAKVFFSKEGDLENNVFSIHGSHLVMSKA